MKNMARMTESRLPVGEFRGDSHSHFTNRFHNLGGRAINGCRTTHITGNRINSTAYGVVSTFMSNSHAVPGSPVS